VDYENDTAWVRGMLYPDENLLWAGKPGKGHFFRREDAVLLLPLLPFCAFAALWICLSIRHGAPLIGTLWGVLVFSACLYWTLGRVIVKRIREKKNRYALTSQRIIIQTGRISKSLDLNYLPRVTVTRFADGNGDIRFGESENIFKRMGFGYERTYTSPLAELANIPDVNGVAYRIRNAVDQALRARLQAQENE